MSRSGKIEASRSSALALAIFAVFILMAGSVSAQTKTNETVEFNSQQQTNPCNGETITFDGRTHLLTNIRTTSDKIFFNIMIDTHGQGVGDLTMTQYTLASQSHQNGKFPLGTVIFRDRNRVTSQGISPNYFFSSVIVANENGTKTHFESSCK